jgi:hypothetical protein
MKPSSSRQTRLTASPLVAGAAGAADAVDVVFADVRDFVVHDVRQLVDVDAAGGDVGGHQRADVAALEAGQRLGAGGLALVAVQRHRLDAVLGQEFGHVVGAELGAGEHQHLAPVVLLDDVRQQRLLLAAADRVDHLRDALHRGVARRDLDALRVLEQPLARSRISSLKVAENSRLCFSLGTRARIFLTSWMKPMSSMRSASSSTRICTWLRSSVPLLLQVEQAAGVATRMSTPFLQFFDLRVHADAAEDHGRGELQVLAVGADDSSTWAASSRVGVSTRARMPLPPNLLVRRCFG